MVGRDSERPSSYLLGPLLTLPRSDLSRATFHLFIFEDPGRQKQGVEHSLVQHSGVPLALHVARAQRIPPASCHRLLCCHGPRTPSGGSSERGSGGRLPASVMDVRTMTSLCASTSVSVKVNTILYRVLGVGMEDAFINTNVHTVQGRETVFAIIIIITILICVCLMFVYLEAGAGLELTT